MPDYIMHSGDEVLAVATVETLIQLVAPSTRRLRLKEVEISFNGVNASGEPVKVDVLRQDDAGTGSAGTVVKLDEADPAALGSGQIDLSAEPTPAAILKQWLVTPYGGLLVYRFAPGEEPIVGASGRVGIRANAPAEVTARASLTWGE